MGWLLGDEKSASSWKVGWTERTLASLDAPPSPLLAVVGIVVVLMSISSYSNYQAQKQTTLIGFRLALLFVLLAFIFVAHSVTKYGAVLMVSPRTKLQVPPSDGAGDGGGSPWGVAVLLVLVVVLVSYQSYLHSKWWPWTQS